MTIGNRIAQLRKAKGFTQEYVADQLGVSRQAVSKWEQDQTSPDTKNLIALAQLLDTDISFLAMGTSSRASSKMDERMFRATIDTKTTTGYILLVLGVIFLLLFMGGCAGSTAGGLKVSRVMLLGKTVVRELKRLVHPRSVGVIRLEGKRVEESVVQSATAYIVLYFLLFGGGFLLLCLEPAFDLESNFTAVAACINNIGPGLELVGPMDNFGKFSDLSKYVLTLDMLAGRLEIFPILVLFSRNTWKKK